MMNSLFKVLADSLTKLGEGHGSIEITIKGGNVLDVITTERTRINQPVSEFYKTITWTTVS